MFDSNNDNQIVMMATAVSQKTEKMVEYIRSLKTLEDAMEPYKEQKRELREEFKRQGWLTKEELSTTVKAYRMMKNDVDLEQFVELYQTLLERSGRGV
jgi:predicted transcriptional regulator